MTFSNHMIGGFVITGVAASICGSNILENPLAIAVTLFAAALPDIDIPTSPMGRIFKPISRLINRKHGHRTITHSAICWLVLTFIFHYFGRIFFATNPLTIFFFWAYFSHLILDLITVNGIAFLYPFKKNRCVAPGDATMRFKTGKFGTEVGMFSFFILSGLFLQPLMKNGFWTSYNRTFASPKHLVSEQAKTKDLLLVEWRTKRGTEILTGSGYVIKATESRIVTIDRATEEFRILDAANEKIQKTLPSHTNKKLRFENYHFVGISEDSLNRIGNGYFEKVEFSSGGQFDVISNNSRVPKRTNNFSGKWLNYFRVETIADATTMQEIDFVNSPKLATISRQIARLQAKEQRDFAAYANVQNKISNIEVDIAKSSSFVERQRLQEELQELRNERKPERQNIRITELRNEAAEVRRTDAIKYRERQSNAQYEYESNRKEAGSFTGYVVRIIIE